MTTVIRYFNVERFVGELEAQARRPRKKTQRGRWVKILSREKSIAKTGLSSDGHRSIPAELMCRRRRQCFRVRSDRNATILDR